MKSMTSSRLWFLLRVRSTRKLERKSWLASVRYHVSADPSAIRPGRLPLNNHSPSRPDNVPEGSIVLRSQAKRIARPPLAWRSLRMWRRSSCPATSTEGQSENSRQRDGTAYVVTAGAAVECRYCCRSLQSLNRADIVAEVCSP